MKRIVGLCACLFFIFSTNKGVAQSKQQDSIAVAIIDRMSDVIGDLQSCSFELTVADDTPDPTFGAIKEFSYYNVCMSGPNKMLIDGNGYRGHRQLFYNGKELAYYSLSENNYGIIPAPPTIIAAIDSLHVTYGIEFPAADFFYPAFTDDLLEDADVIKYLGIVSMHGEEYFHLIASGKDKNFEFWIHNDMYNLPARFVITDKTQKGNPQHQVAFSNWQINPSLPSAAFDFSPPPGARQIRILPKSEK